MSPANIILLLSEARKRRLKEIDIFIETPINTDCYCQPYQYCDKCGIPDKNKSFEEWKEQSDYEIIRGICIAFAFIGIPWIIVLGRLFGTW